MKTKKSLTLLALLVAAGLAAIATLNYAVNPLCYFHCDNVSLTVRTVNSYYQNAQRILQFPDTELVVIGSSRGESLPLAWLAQSTHLRTINLSVGGAEMHAESAFLEFARSRLRLKKVVWIADYFSLIEESASEKIRFTPALRHMDDSQAALSLSETLKSLTLLFDHNTLEASFSLLKQRRKPPAPQDRGAATGLDEKTCESRLAKTKQDDARLQKEIGQLFDSYAHQILQPPQSERAFQRLAQIAAELRKDGTELVIFIPGYHPAFWARLQAEYPVIAQRHENWVQRLEQLRGPGVKVLDFFHGLPGDDGSSRFWSDGVHFTCHAAIAALQHGL